jgi:hypothetical protein
LRRDLGDFQTPPALVAEVLDALGPIGRQWPRVLEPTCGCGHFLAGLLGSNDPPRELIGIEIQQAHAAAARASAGNQPPTPGAQAVAVTIVAASLFDLDLRRDLAWHERGPLLVVGNPPWITSAALGALSSENLPRKWNVKGARGLEARTGAANFDIAEAVWLKLIDELAGGDRGEPVTIALLCKTSVARSVLEHAGRRALPLTRATLTRIDARRWFGAEVEACLFRLTLGSLPGPRIDRVPVYPALGATVPTAEMGFARDRLVADLNAFQRAAFADGTCPIIWRQGLKHDAAAVMELTRVPADADRRAAWRNKQGEPVDVESTHVYPLLKGSDLSREESATSPQRAVIVTQSRIGQDTRPLEQSAPRLWAYLTRHAPTFARRKSSIYDGQPPFALFGIGPYSFAPYKVAVSGLHKAVRFRVVGPVAGRPVMLDDTSYFLPCDSPEQAALVAAILDEDAARDLLHGLSFPGAKRPITKALLQRLDLDAIAARADRARLLARAGALRERWLGGTGNPEQAEVCPLPLPAPRTGDCQQHLETWRERREYDRRQCHRPPAGR